MTSSGYQMVNAIREPGGVVEIGIDGPDVVIRPGGKRVITLNAAKREEWQRLFMEAERQAEADAPLIHSVQERHPGEETGLVYEEADDG